jgi:hypothetical protein
MFLKNMLVQELPMSYMLELQDLWLFSCSSFFSFSISLSSSWHIHLLLVV